MVCWFGHATQGVCLANVWLCVHLPLREMHVELGAPGVQVLPTEVSPSPSPYCSLPAPSAHPFAELSPLVLRLFLSLLPQGSL